MKLTYFEFFEFFLKMKKMGPTILHPKEEHFYSSSRNREMLLTSVLFGGFIFLVCVCVFQHIQERSSPSEVFFFGLLAYSS